MTATNELLQATQAVTGKALGKGPENQPDSEGRSTEGSELR